MSLSLIILAGGLAGLVGIVVGYFLRQAIALGRKGSIELEIKRILADAQEQAKQITAEAEKKSIDTLREVRVEIKEKEDQVKKIEDRLVKKEEFLDKRQLDIDAEVEGLKTKIAEIKVIKDKVDNMHQEKLRELEKLGHLSESEAKDEL
jgi:ribonuclease Y